jgi:hypothetical protein
MNWMIQNSVVQLHLSDYGKYHGKIDGDFGPRSKQAIRDHLSDDVKVQHTGWDDDRARAAVEQFMFELKGIELGDIDGLIGPNTLAALEKYQRVVVDQAINPRAVVLKSHKWPRQTQRELIDFFGPVGTRQTMCNLPYDMELAWDSSVRLTKFSCHELVKAPFERIFAAALDHYGINALKKMGLTKFGGCLNVRRKRGGSSMSLHSWGIAVDMDPSRNPLRANASSANMATKQFDAWWSIVESEGMVSLGRERNFDWMHFQAAIL